MLTISELVMSRFGLLLPVQASGQIPWASYFQPFNEWDDPQALADQAQADLQAGLDAVGK